MKQTTTKTFWSLKYYYYLNFCLAKAQKSFKKLVFAIPLQSRYVAYRVIQIEKQIYVLFTKAFKSSWEQA